MLLAEQMAGSSEKENVTATARQIEHEVEEWGTRASGYYTQKAAEVREIMRPIPVPLPSGEGRWGLCDGLHRDDHEFVPA